MAKYSYELKKKIVEEYLNGKAGHKILAKKYQIGVSQIERWVNKGVVGKIKKNRIHRRFNTSFPYQKITTDTTEFKY